MAGKPKPMSQIKQLYPWRFGLSGPYGPVPGFDVQRKMTEIEDDEWSARRSGTDRIQVRSMRNRKFPFSGGLAGIAGSDCYRRS